MVSMFLQIGGEFLPSEEGHAEQLGCMVPEPLVAKAGAAWLTAATQGSLELKNSLSYVIQRAQHPR